MDYASVCYKKSCISQVIIRIDFLEFIDSKALFDEDIERSLIVNFPKKGMQQIIRFQTMNFTVDPSGAKTEGSTQEGLQQEFSNFDGNKIVLSNKFIVLELNKYSKYEIELTKLFPVLRNLMTRTRLTAMRTGIRYINMFEKNGIKPQKGYFNSPVSALADSKICNAGKAVPIRAMALNEFVVDDMRLNFRYGQYNQQYPRPIKQVSFVLDYDCFCEEPLSGYDGIVEHINKGHDAIQELFENSITDKLRKVMTDE